MINQHADGPAREILTSVLDYAGFVDANCLCFLWPEEFASLRICLVSGTNNAPIFSTFAGEVRHSSLNIF
jgi:hypothetical protein